jgi:uncharacterized membrane protein YphA (DoxX/SURF4 family)
MTAIINLCNCAQDIFDKLRSAVDFIGPLSLRIYLAPIFILAGINKLSAIEDVAWWFASLGIPEPTLMVWAAGLTELIGGIFLLGGVAVRWVAIPLMFTMVVAATTAHWDNGWHVLPETWLTEHGNITILKNGIEFAATYFIMLLALFATGGGKYISIDYWLARKFRPT